MELHHTVFIIGFLGSFAFFSLGFLFMEFTGFGGFVAYRAHVFLGGLEGF